MNELQIQEYTDKLTGIINQIKYSGNDNEGLLKINSYIPELKAILNDIFAEYKYVCLDVLYTLNTDNEYFGVIVNPSMDGMTAFKIFATGEAIRLANYQLELDSKLFTANLSADEIAALILFEVSSILDPSKIEQVRNLVDLHVLADDDVINLRDSLNYNQLIIYAIKDTLYKVSALIFKETEDDILSNNAVSELNIKDSLLTAQEKLISNVYGMMDTVRTQKTVVLGWVFLIYTDVQGYAVNAIDTLKDAKQFTGSKLQKFEIDKTIDAISKISTVPVKENMSLNKFFESKAMYSLNELGLFKSLKQSGLRAIEDDYYEIAVRAKAIETEDDALYVIRCINSRLSILEDYIYNNTLSQSEKNRWLALAKQYRDLRNTVTEKKISKKKYADLFNDPTDYED